MVQAFLKTSMKFGWWTKLLRIKKGVFLAVPFWEFKLPSEHWAMIQIGSRQIVYRRFGEFDSPIEVRESTVKSHRCVSALEHYNRGQPNCNYRYGP